MAETKHALTAPQAARHASWLELFFDLVAVAGVGQLAHLLHGAPDWHDAGLYVVLFLAFWSAWTCTTLYGNIAAETVHVSTVLLCMFGLTVMAAAVHGVQEGEHARAFAIGYVFVRVLGSKVLESRRQALVDWPVAQIGAGVLPWTVSIWVPESARYWLWAAGVAIDLGLTFLVSGRHLREQVDEHVRRENEKSRREVPGRRSRSGGGPGRAVEIVRTDVEHLAERLGLFVLIVLGEAVYQLVEVGSEADWRKALFAGAAPAFLAVVLLWWLSLQRGFGGVPLAGATTLSPRTLMGLHCLVAGSLAAFAAGLGSALEHADGRLPAQTAWIMACALGAHLCVATALGALTRPVARPRLLLAAVPALAVCAAVGAVGETGRPVLTIWLLVAAVAWFSYATTPSGRGPAPEPTPTADRPGP
ncbi:low temperature requirement protein A [Streptomyces sp. NPDC008150]|uniref:low temperature requirement protein A n=1 Tax=Streptomyces sp. NPDC008150 TaxID=3364816 RepID=UPI0036EFD071